MSAPPFQRYDSNYSKFYQVDTANCYLDTPENKDPLAEYSGGSVKNLYQLVVIDAPRRKTSLDKQYHTIKLQG
ncbi:hypothetical protein J14TS5_06880 [Paenibacillus lautus]|nr:hypothetical protein J14TS5_06880 [Paenibacillus lautus]